MIFFQSSSDLIYIKISKIMDYIYKLLLFIIFKKKFRDFIRYYFNKLFYLNLKNILIKLKDLTFIEYKNVVNKNKKL